MIENIFPHLGSTDHDMIICGWLPRVLDESPIISPVCELKLRNAAWPLSAVLANARLPIGFRFSTNRAGFAPAFFNHCRAPEYKTRERIQRAIDDTRLLAIPTS
ncbi:MAG: hypothetical protein HW383_573 [Candidatus Magasanikbacteria bacterium]|nr:hypothetical protein [Candidatus Magasanikbacteria bacterium]